MTSFLRPSQPSLSPSRTDTENASRGRIPPSKLASSTHSRTSGLHTPSTVTTTPDILPDTTSPTQSMEDTTNDLKATVMALAYKVEEREATISSPSFQAPFTMNPAAGSFPSSSNLQLKFSRFPVAVLDSIIHHEFMAVDLVKHHPDPVAVSSIWTCPLQQVDGFLVQVAVEANIKTYTTPNHVLLNFVSWARVGLSTGPSVYIAQTAEVRKPHFSLGAALCFSSPSQLRADLLSYLLAIYSLSTTRQEVLELKSILVCNDMESRKSFVHVAQTVARLRPNSFFLSAGIVVALLQSHGWVGLNELDSKASYNSAMSTMNTDAFYSGAIEAMTPAARVLIEIPLQAGEILGSTESAAKDPWNFDGAFIQAKDYETIQDFPMHSVTWWVNSLRVAVLFGAKEEVLSDLVSKMLANRAAVPGLVTELELLWLLSIYYLIYGDDSKQAEVEANITEIHRYSASIDYRARLQVLEVARSIRVVRSGGAWSTAITEVESCLSSLLADGFELLAGLASLLTAQLLADIDGGSLRLASGYARTAYSCFLACEAAAVGSTRVGSR
ncbi:hypothetical protein BDY24DRAFT_413376 [Mrakia frigida]|uniref:uncharacterized protein n=1 Tax=Mrakia frigida TaxID=29902 RepID=UPI003FCC2341